MLENAMRNRKRPVGCRLSDAPSSVRQPAPRDLIDLSEVWGAAHRIDGGTSPDAQEADRWLMWWCFERGLDPEVLLREDLCRAVNKQAQHPSCRINRRSWADAGYRLLFPLVDAHGEIVSVRARRFTTDQGGPKEISPQRAVVTGLVYANATARGMLAGTGNPTEVWVVEGGPDHATTVTVHAWKNIDAAVIGIFAGSWTAELAARIPTGTRVVLATHRDPAGDSYARTIAATLEGRCTLERLKLPDGVDINEAHRTGRFDLAAREPVANGRRVPQPDLVRGETGWSRRVLELLQQLGSEWTGTARELARTFLMMTNQRTTPAAVRGLERGILRLRERGRLPAGVTLVPATPAVERRADERHDDGGDAERPAGGELDEASDKLVGDDALDDAGDLDDDADEPSNEPSDAGDDAGDLEDAADLDDADADDAGDLEDAGDLDDDAGDLDDDAGDLAGDLADAGDLDDDADDAGDLEDAGDLDDDAGDLAGDLEDAAAFVPHSGRIEVDDDDADDMAGVDQSGITDPEDLDVNLTSGPGGITDPEDLDVNLTSGAGGDFFSVRSAAARELERALHALQSAAPHVLARLDRLRKKP